MAQAKTSGRKRSTTQSKNSSAKSRSGSNSAKSRNGGTRSSAKSRNGSTRSSAKSTGKRGAAKTGSVASSPEPLVNAIAAKDAAAAGTKAAGRAVAAAASRAKVPLIVGGAALAGAAGGLVAKSRAASRGRGSRFSLPMRDGKLDLDAVASAARRVGSIGEQLGDVANAIQRAGDQSKKS